MISAFNSVSSSSWTSGARNFFPLAIQLVMYAAFTERGDATCVTTNTGGASGAETLCTLEDAVVAMTAMRSYETCDAGKMTANKNPPPMKSATRRWRISILSFMVYRGVYQKNRATIRINVPLEWYRRAPTTVSRQKACPWRTDPDRGVEPRAPSP